MISENQFNKDRYSCCIVENLDAFGYSTGRTKQRIRNWKLVSDAKTIAAHRLKHGKIEQRYVGSQGEGIALMPESDVDILQTNHSVLCVDNLDTCSYNDRIIFHLEREGAPAGYAYLRLTDKGNNDIDYMRDIRHALEQDRGEKYLSSRQYLAEIEDFLYHGDGYVSRNTLYKAGTGPAIRKSNRTIRGNFSKWWYKSTLNEDTDFVQAFPCQCPQLLQAWSSRARPYDWPSQEMMQIVESLPCHVVAVGKKESLHEHLQWRISFTLAEMHLVQTLNDTQRKVLIVLRHIAKRYLKPLSPSITSYVIKNVVLLMAEKTPLDQFQPHLLMDRLKDALKFLQSCITHRSLKNYMIPERDLLQDKLSHTEQDSLLQETARIVHNCESYIEEFYVDMIGSRHESFLWADILNSYNRIDIQAAEVTDLYTAEQMAEQIEFVTQYCNRELLYNIYVHRIITLPYIWRHKWRLLKNIVTRHRDWTQLNEVPHVAQGNDGLSSKQVGSQASCQVTWQLPWIQPFCICINADPALKGLNTSDTGNTNQHQHQRPRGMARNFEFNTKEIRVFILGYYNKGYFKSN